MYSDGWDKIIDAVNDNLPQFNKYTLRGYRQSQIEMIPDYLDMVFSEAVKRYGFADNGNLKSGTSGTAF